MRYLGVALGRQSIVLENCAAFGNPTHDTLETPDKYRVLLVSRF